MKNIFLVILVLLAGLVVVGFAQAQSVSEPSGQKTLAATVGVYAFPAAGQGLEEQSKNEAECYSWAANNTKSDPFNLAKKMKQTDQAAAQQKAQIKQEGQGAGAAGAVGGAAMGALIGEITSGDASEGAAWGAAAGLIAGRRKARRAKKGATQQVEHQTERQQQATVAQIESFKKAFGVCLEAKNYLVRF